ncbi:MAG: hypothetical protein IH843_05120 [Thaumarchaeota archaeon]|nr:hypothetical protein [Nitrososphaerota archaeon]
MKIKIVKVPTGQAPQEVRDLWVGCVLEVYGLNKDGVVRGVGDKKPQVNEHSFGYVVTKEECIGELRRLDRHLAARFWEIALPENEAIVFGRQFCEQY